MSARAGCVTPTHVMADARSAVGGTTSTHLHVPPTFSFAPLVPLKYELIVIDPPWPLMLRTPEGYKKSALAHYQLMDADGICAMPVGTLASRDCLLYCWATAPQLPLALAAIAAWGFEYKSIMMWRKTTRLGNMRWGTGYRVRSTGELVIVATIGRPVQAYAPPTVFDGLAREHSRKPEEFYALCDRILPGARRADVFSRQERAGWDAFGWEVGRFT